MVSYTLSPNPVEHVFKKWIKKIALHWFWPQKTALNLGGFLEYKIDPSASP